MLEFEFDPAKSAANLVKHGIDFTEAQTLWRDTHRIEVPARIAGRVWSAIVTYRDQHVRIISVRPSRESEVALYEG